MRMLRRLVLLLVVLWVVVEIAAIPVANRMIEEQVAAQTRGVASVKASVGTFPVVARFVLTGKISRVGVTLVRVARAALTFTEVRFDLSGVELDRGRLLKNRQAHITAVDTATITATLDTSALPPRLAGAVARNVRISGRTLLLGPASFQLASDILPCSPSAHVVGSSVILTCTIDHVPPALLETAQR
jgi:hypothetical protein